MSGCNSAILLLFLFPNQVSVKARMSNNFSFINFLTSIASFAADYILGKAEFNGLLEAVISRLLCSFLVFSVA